MIFEEVIASVALRFQVVHSVPGRFRLHIPVAKKIPKEWQFDRTYMELFTLIKGVKSVDFNYTTLNAVITYDVKQTTEEKIIAKAKKMLKKIASHKAELSTYTHEQKDEAYAHVKKLAEKYV